MLKTLQENGLSTELAETFVQLAAMVKEISEEIIRSSAEKVGSTNSSGEEQIAMDVKAQEIFEVHMKNSPFVGAIASEELEGIQKTNPDGIYSVVTDPLDGSSLMDVNFSVGTIVGIYESLELMGQTGRNQVGALYAIYGPRTTLMLSGGNGVLEFTLMKDGWELTNENVKLKDGKKHFAPGNLRATAERDDYLELVNDFMKQQYTLRYSGGMVPDINHILKKGHGVFMYPGMPSAPNGKLRLLFETAPLAFIMEEAGGAASDGAVDILDIVVEEVHQRTPIYIGTPEEVARCKEKLKR